VREDWVTLREAICEDVLSNGYKEAVGAFTSAYDDAEPDAAALAVGLTGLLPPGDERFLGTVKFVEKHLRDGPTVYRYRFDDGLPGKEGGFHLCMAWLIESMWLIGRRDEARRLLDELAALAGPTGMMAEQYDPGARQSLGNHPQAYSHLGLINAAVRLAGG
jgi:GH15 family glucan-1,4-alpha-glucosidase